MGGSFRWMSVLMVALLAGSAHAQFGPAGPAPRGAPDDGKVAGELAQTSYRENLAKYKDNADYLVLPGLLASRKDRTVRLWGKSTHLTSADPVEFFVIPDDSGKDYESVAEVFCKSSDVRKALEFIGMKPGRPVDFANNVFWPKGERVIAHIEWNQPGAKPGDKPEPARIRAEDLLFDVNTRKSLERTGFVFTGSCYLKSPDSGKELFAADVLDSRSIISDYNERCAILDVPRQAPQSSVYGSIRMNAAYRFAPAQPLQITLEPERRDGTLRVHDYSLSIAVAPGAGLQDGQFVLKDAAGKQLNAQPSLVHVLAEFGRLTDAGIDPYVTVTLDDAMTLATAQQVARFLSTIDVEKGIRIEAPLPGRLYYRNYTPRPEWRDRTKRLGRPWELHVADVNGRVQGGLILPADEIDNNNGAGDLHFPVTTPAEVEKVLREKSDKWAHSVYIFAPPQMRVGELLKFIGEGMKVKPGMFVFLEKPAPQENKPAE